MSVEGSAADAEAIAASKQLLRKAVRLRRDARDPERRRADDADRTLVLTAALGGEPPPTVAAYLSVGSEPGTRRLVGWLAAHDVRVLLPSLAAPGPAGVPDPAWAWYAGPDRLRVGHRGILEPAGDLLPVAAVAEADLLICPGLAADRQGRRLGRGGGWYDRVLGHVRDGVETWLLLNDDEVLPEVPTDRWDRRVDVVVTPTRLLRCG